MLLVGTPLSRYLVLARPRLGKLLVSGDTGPEDCPPSLVFGVAFQRAGVDDTPSINCQSGETPVTKELFSHHPCRAPEKKGTDDTVLGKLPRLTRLTALIHKRQFLVSPSPFVIAIGPGDTEGDANERE